MYLPTNINFLDLKCAMEKNTSWKENPIIKIVATLALGSWPKQGLQRCKPRGKPGNHISCSRECKRVWGKGMNPHIPKWTFILGVGVPNGFLNLQRAIAGVKTQWIEAFSISLEKLAWPIWTFETQVMAKRNASSQIGSLTPHH